MKFYRLEECMRHVSLLLFLLLFACKPSDSALESGEQARMFFHPYAVALKWKHSDSLARVSYYGQHNFVFVGDSIFAYFEYPNKYGCDMGIPSEQVNRPLFLHLLPGDIRWVWPSVLESVMDTLLKKERTISPLIIKIASSRDTIRHPEFRLWMKRLREKNVILLAPVIWTEEEQQVIQAKLNNRLYEPRRINWKTEFQQTPFPAPPRDSVIGIHSGSKSYTDLSR